MRGQLHWREAQPADIGALQDFCCTANQRRRGHPEPWLLQAQGMVRNCRPGTKRDRRVLLGCDDIGIAAVLSFRIEEGGSFVMLEVMALDYRVRGERLGDEVMEQFVGHVTQQTLERGCSSFTVQAKVDHRNVRSVRLVERWGFRYAWSDHHYLVYEAKEDLQYAEPPRE